MKKGENGSHRKFRDIIRLSHSRRSEAPAVAREPRAQSPPSGVIKFETGKLPSEFAGYQDKRTSNRPATVVMVIIAAAFIFIAIIAWLVAHEPPG
ncbi:MAG TPA: hypothetical protein VNH22_01090 [Blastocatellia bacterium]|jgi:hypothetical protein|nr:hypothetical protein [Blastocatellia bacterium]